MVHLFLGTTGSPGTITVMSLGMIRVRLNCLSFTKFTESSLITTKPSRNMADLDKDYAGRADIRI